MTLMWMWKTFAAEMKPHVNKNWAHRVHRSSNGVQRARSLRPSESFCEGNTDFNSVCQPAAVTWEHAAVPQFSSSDVRYGFHVFRPLKWLEQIKSERKTFCQWSFLLETYKKNQSALDKGQRARSVEGKVVKKQFVLVSVETFSRLFRSEWKLKSPVFQSCFPCAGFCSPSGLYRDKNVIVDGLWTHNLAEKLFFHKQKPVSLQFWICKKSVWGGEKCREAEWMKVSHDPWEWTSGLLMVYSRRHDRRLNHR